MRNILPNENVMPSFKRRRGKMVSFSRQKLGNHTLLASSTDPARAQATSAAKAIFKRANGHLASITEALKRPKNRVIEESRVTYILLICPLKTLKPFIFHIFKDNSLLLRVPYCRRILSNSLEST